MDEDKGFEVVDKRGVETTEPPQEEPVAQAPEEEPVSETPEAQEKEEARAPDIYAVVTWMIGILTTAAWQSMGIQLDPSTGKAEKNMEQAKVAIDCIVALADRVSPHLSEEDRREVRGIISDLQLNFVNQSR